MYLGKIKFQLLIFDRDIGGSEIWKSKNTNLTTTNTTIKKLNLKFYFLNLDFQISQPPIPRLKNKNWNFIFSIEIWISRPLKTYSFNVLTWSTFEKRPFIIWKVSKKGIKSSSQSLQYHYCLNLCIQFLFKNNAFYTNTATVVLMYQRLQFRLVTCDMYKKRIHSC